MGPDSQTKHPPPVPLEAGELPRPRRRLLGLLLAMALLGGVLYAAVVPPWQSPDEPGHFEYVALLYRLGHVPR